MCEVSESGSKRIDPASLIDSVVNGAIATGLLSRGEKIISRWHYRAGYGYPVPGLLRDPALEHIIPEFERHDVYSRGRFGIWKYEVSNQDHSFMQGVEVVERTLFGRAEITAMDAETANAKKHPWPFEVWQKPEFTWAIA